MATVSELWRQSKGGKQHWWVFVGGYAGVVLALLLAVLLGEGSTVADGVLLPVALFYAPPVVSAMSAFRGGGVLASLAVGLTPGLSYGLVVGTHTLVVNSTLGEAPFWALTAGFGLLGVVESLLGYGVGTGVLRFVRGRELR